MSLTVTSAHGYEATISGWGAGITRAWAFAWFKTSDGSTHRGLVQITQNLFDGTQDYISLSLDGSINIVAGASTANVDQVTPDPGDFYFWQAAQQNKWTVGCAVLDTTGTANDLRCIFGRAAATAKPATTQTAALDLGATSAALTRIRVLADRRRVITGDSANDSSMSTIKAAYIAVGQGSVPSQAQIQSCIDGMHPADLPGVWEYWNLTDSGSGLVGALRSITLAPFGGSATTTWDGADNPTVNPPAGDTTPPTLTSPTGTGGALTCSGTVSTNEANGTLYTSFTGSATAPTAVQVEAGQDHTGAAALRAVSQAVSATGTQNVASGSITAGTRYAHFMHKDAAGNRSTVVSSGSFTVTSGSTPVSFTGTVSAQSGTVGTAFAWTGSALSSFFSGSLTPFAYSVVTGSLPPGLTLNSSTGVVSGTPTTAGTYNATFRATDTGTNTANSNSVAFTIAAAPPPPPPPPGSATLTLAGFKQWTGTAWTSITVPFVKVCRASTGAVVLEVSSAAVNASGNMTITSGSLTAGVVYVVFGFNTDGTLSFKKTVTAA